MTNDLNTLSGALLEMKDQLIYELGQKGVTASYSSTTGLLGLIGKISEIQTTGGSCYHIELDESTYETAGTFTVSATLQNQYQPYPNQTVTFTGGTSTVTATTDSNGVATATVTFSQSGTLTATYSNVTATASVTVVSYLFYDPCTSATGLTNYGSSVAVRGSGSSMSIEYDSNENAYKVKGSGNYYAMIPIPVLNDEDGFKISADFKGLSSGANGVGFCIDNRNDTTSYSYAIWEESVTKFLGKQFTLTRDGTVNQHTGLSMNANTYYHMELIVNGTSLTGKLYDGATLLATDTTTLSISNKQVGIFLLTQNGTTNSACYVKNIKAEAL